MKKLMVTGVLSICLAASAYGAAPNITSGQAAPMMNIVDQAANDVTTFVENGIRVQINSFLLTGGEQAQSPALRNDRKQFAQNFNVRYSNLNALQIDQVADRAHDQIQHFIQQQAQVLSHSPKFYSMMARGDACSAINQPINNSFAAIEKAIPVLQKDETGTDSSILKIIWVSLASLDVTVMVDTSSGIAPAYHSCNGWGKFVAWWLQHLDTAALKWELGL
jgi:hypothetical protein